MSRDNPGQNRPGRSAAWPVVHTVLRGVLGAALLVLVVLIVVRQVPSSSVAATNAASTTPLPSAVATMPTATAANTVAPTDQPTFTTGSGSGGGSGGSAGSGSNSTPQPEKPAITSFQGPSSVTCLVPAEAPATSSAEQPVLSFSWSSTGSSTAYFGVATKDAEAEPYSTVGTSDSIALDFQCPNSSEIYTVTVIGPGGKASKTITVTNTGYTG